MRSNGIESLFLGMLCIPLLFLLIIIYGATKMSTEQSIKPLLEKIEMLESLIEKSTMQMNNKFTTQMVDNSTMHKIHRK